MALVISVVFVLSFITVSYAEDGIIAEGTAGSNVKWELDNKGVLTISGNGAITVGWYVHPWSEYDDYVQEVVVEEGITNIPDTVFYDLQNLTKVSIPSTVIEIGDTDVFAMDYCLEEINISLDNETYKSVEGVVYTKDMKTLIIYPANKPGSTYNIPDSVTRIGDGAFSRNQNITYLNIPSGVTEIGEMTFGYSRLKQVVITGNVKEIPSDCFFASDVEEINIPDSVENIGTYAFYGAGIKSMVIGSNVKRIKKDAFGECHSLEVIHYVGTENQWDSILAESRMENSAVEIHYVDKDTYVAALEATCIQNGHTGKYWCEECSEYTGFEIPSCHEYKNGICKKCNTKCLHDAVSAKGYCYICNMKCGIIRIKPGETKKVSFPGKYKDCYYGFEPSESGVYKITLKSIEGNNTSSVNILDNEGLAIDSHLQGMTDKEYTITFDATKDEVYEIELMGIGDSSEYEITVDKYKGITHQPSSGEPYIGHSWNINGKYQWYKAKLNGAEITDENAEPVDSVVCKSCYDEEKGWILEEDTNFYYVSFFSVPLRAGESIVVELKGNYLEGVYLSGTDTESKCFVEKRGQSLYELTAVEDDVYVLYTGSTGGEISARAYFGKIEYEKINGQTSSTLTEYTFGENYACKSVVDNVTYVSDTFKCRYAILHQPTNKELYVKPNIDKNTKYQWYKVESITETVTDENAEVISDDRGTSYYEDGVWYVADGEAAYAYQHDYFRIPLKKGDTLTVEVTGQWMSMGIVDYLTLERAWTINDGKTVYNITAQEDGDYTFMVHSSVDNVGIKAHVTHDKYEKIEGETEAALKSPEIDITYACQVTFGDDTVEMSKSVTFIQNEDSDTDSEPGDDIGNDTDNELPKMSDNFPLILLLLIGLAAYILTYAVKNAERA